MLNIYAGEQEAEPNRPLDSIRFIADEAEATVELIQDFISRFRNGAGGATGKAVVPVPSGHGGQLVRLRDAVAEVNKAARELSTLG